ncbi:hypothetical protein J6590_028865 [Homalodisca vitripennis]|nr:hypothetical protein J6590_028865 [Homalodisca vitripennis]
MVAYNERGIFDQELNRRVLLVLIRLTAAPQVRLYDSFYGSSCFCAAALRFDLQRLPIPPSPPSDPRLIIIFESLQSQAETTTAPALSPTLLRMRIQFLYFDVISA